jgi:hypothetical protein
MLFDFIKNLIPTVKKSSLEDDLEEAQKTFADIAVPTLVSASDLMKLQTKHSDLFTSFNDIFYTNIGIRRSKYFVSDLLEVVTNAQQNTDFVKKEVRKNLDEVTITDVISADKAQLIRAAMGLSVIADLVPQVMNTLMRAESALYDKSIELTKSEFDHAQLLFRRLCSRLSSFGRPSAVFQKQLGAVPDARITLDNMSQVEAMHLKDIDPFAEAEANGFVPHPVLLVREQWANFQIWRYERNKRLKKTFELRVLMLKAQMNKEDTAALEGQIEYYENEIVKYTDKIDAFEKKWG